MGLKCVVFFLLLQPIPAFCEIQERLLETIDLAQYGVKNDRELKLTVYRSVTGAARRPLAIFIPNAGTQIKDNWFEAQAQYFTDMGYVVAIPQIGNLYSTDVSVPIFEDGPRSRDLAVVATPYAIEVLALVAYLTDTRKIALPDHIVVGVGFGSLVAARYAALNPPGCKGLVLISAGFALSGQGMTRSEEAFAEMGKSVKTPSIWLYAAHNQRIRESHANRLFDAFSHAGGKATLIKLPELGMDGDALFVHSQAPPLWQPEINKFLSTLSVDRESATSPPKTAQ